MRCRRCRRVLTDPESRSLGYGKTCYEKTFGKMTQRVKPSRMTRMAKQRNQHSDSQQLTLFDDNYFGEEVNKHMEIKCQRCGLKPDEIQEYIDYAKEDGITPEEFVLEEEGTYNKETGLFWCTECYVALDMPVGVAREITRQNE